MTPGIPINAAVLRWAREAAGLSEIDVARELKKKRITAETIKEWEQGKKRPTYSLLEQLAYKIYNRPLAIFFFPSPPEETTPKQSFRTLPDHELKRMSPRMRYLIRIAYAMQLNLAELYDFERPTKQFIIHDLKYSADNKITQMVTDVRQYFGIELNIQNKWRNDDEAFKNWRNALESFGIFVFKDAFKDDAFSGFCLYDAKYPIIYVNNSKTITRQIFTLFHELAHLLFGIGGVDTRLDEYLRYLHGNDKRIEIMCNQFASSFLVPDDDFDRRIDGMVIDDNCLKNLAKYYHVSREVILRKCFDRDLVSETFYNRKAGEWIKQIKEKKGGGGNYYLTKGVYLGQTYLEQAFKKYYNRQIGIERLAKYLDVKTKSVPGMETLLGSRGAML